MLAQSVAPPFLTFESIKSCSCSSVFLPFISSFTQQKLSRGLAPGPIFRNCVPNSGSRSQSIPVLEDEASQSWESCRHSLSALSFGPEEADGILSKAFGWVHSPYWGEERAKVIPKSETIEETLNYLMSLGLSNDGMFKLLKKFPEVLGCCLDDELKANVAVLEEDWGIKGNTLRNLLLRNPKVLGYNVDCKGDCMAKCTRCWVRF